MLNSTEHEIYHANNCQNANNCWILTFISMMYTESESLKVRNIFIFSSLVFMRS